MTKDFTVEREPPMHYMTDHHIYSILNAGLESFCLKLQENSIVNVAQSTTQVL